MDVVVLDVSYLIVRLPPLMLCRAVVSYLFARLPSLMLCGAGAVVGYLIIRLHLKATWGWQSFYHTFISLSTEWICTV